MNSCRPARAAMAIHRLRKSAVRKSPVPLLAAAGLALLSACAGNDRALPPVAKPGNPVFTGWSADPDVAVFDNQYWIYTTYSAPYGRQVYFNAFSSPDLVTWTRYLRVLEVDAVPWARRAMRSPAIAQKDGKYFLFFAANDIERDNEYGGIGVAVASRPDGPFIGYLGRPLIDEFHNGAKPTGPFVFHDDDGRWYLLYGGQKHCNIALLSDDFRSIDRFPDGAQFEEITPTGYVECPVMFRRAGKYYLMWSEGDGIGPESSVAYAIADSPTGPFDRIGEVLQRDPAIATGVGHHSVLRIPGTDEYYIVYHRRPPRDADDNHRVICIDRMDFEADGRIRPVKMTLEGVGSHPLAR